MSDNTASASAFDADELEILNLTIGTRKKIIEHMMKDGVDQLGRGVSTLVRVMDGLDNTVLSKAKIKNDKEAAASASEVINTMAQVLLQHKSKPRLERGPRILEIPSDIHVKELVPGELDRGSVPITYDEVMNA